MEEASATERHWFALYTKPRHEFKAALYLNGISVENYLPTIIVTRKWSDRKKKVKAPLFTGYVFINADQQERNKALQHESILRTVSFMGKPAVIPDWQIENLKNFLNDATNIVVGDIIKTGSKVKITEGPFLGVIGVVQNVESEQWLYISVDFINRSISVKLPKESVIKYVEK